ncbi:transposase [Streptococcus pneumoniae]|nr:IS66 family transposase zinc-finger binding domain-containing protein [Streptococcus pneumoniae]SNO33604.1 transposase [Streptococcus pneumoniae]
MKIIQQQSAIIDSLTNELSLLCEQVAYLTQKLSGKSSEKSVCPFGQLNLFEEHLHLRKMEMFPVETEEITYKRKKSKGKRQAILAQFDSEEVHHQVEESICPDCQDDLKEIGASLQRQELVFIPAQLKRVDHIQHAYKCQTCSKNNPSDKIVKAPIPKAPL